MTTRKYQVCQSGILIIKSKDKEKNIKSESIKIKQLDVRCTICGDQIQKLILTKEDRRSTRDIYAQINGLLTSVEVRKIRKQLNLTKRCCPYLWWWAKCF